MNRDDEFLQVRYRADQWKPTIRHRKLRLIKTGTWFFGLFNTYRMEYTEWEEE
jgi:hypothetical protein